ncbi:hypothetical protein F0562_029456 [Nyssa sinensis]|uniref:Uncharacterized protein n=1 Tax=Nyssa sinensis TaxID=561372 RepID=A0A5J5B2W3_9ASTE|nr:hypothetical protein F0562_029456 [Nyssa sinensis]
MAGITLLNVEQLRKLAKIVNYKEAEAIKSIQFKSEPERAKYLRNSKANYESIVRLLDDGGELERKFQNDKTLAPIAHDIFSYVQKCVNLALQAVRNYCLRMNFLNKIGEHAKTLMNELRVLQEVDPGNVTNAARLAKEAAQYKNAMLEYTKKYQNPMSRSFPKWLKESGLKFEDLVQRYQAKLKFDGPFKHLEDTKKIKVYEEIIEPSGRGKVIVNNLSKAFGIAGIAVLLFTAGIMVWDIFSSEHILETATRDVVSTIALVGGAMLGKVVGAALSTVLVGVKASALFVLMAGIISSIVGAFILGEFAGWFIDLIFGSGGSTPLSTDGHQCYIAPMADVEALARQMAHQSNFTNEAS